MIITHNGTILTNDGVVLNNIITSPSFTNTYSLDFDGVDDYIDCGVVNQVQTFSVSMWVNPLNWGASRVALQMGQSSNYGLSFWFMVDGTLRCLGSNGTNDSYFGNAVANADTYLPSGSWGHILFTHEQTGTGATQKIYINGVLRNTYTSTTHPYTVNYLGNPLYIAQRNNNTYHWQGNIGPVALFDNDQSANASTIYNSGTPTDLTSLNPIAYYKMGENATFKDPQWLLPSNENKDKISNYSMSFDGTDDGFLMAADSALTLSGAFSISIWMKGTVSSNCYLFSRQFMYVQHTGVNKIRMRTFENGGSYQTVETGTVNIYDDNWHHILITYQIGGNASIYLDGVLKTNPVVTQLGFVAGAIPIGIGTDYLGSGSFFTGQIDDIAFWHNTDVSSSVSTIYNGGTPNDLTSLSPSVWLKAGDDATYNFSTSGWTMTNNGTTGIYDAESINMDINDRVGDAPGSSGNTVSFNMDINDRVGESPGSENNALSYNMALSGRTSDVPT